MDLSRAKQTLLENDSLRFAAVKDCEIITDTDYSLRPLLKLLDAHRTLAGFTAADRVIGKGGALLYVLLGVRTVYAPIMSRDALETLERHGINADYEELVPTISNYAETGICPIEDAVSNIDDPLDAESAIRPVVAGLAKVH
ncbi:DUF1893 domain-containing protein [Bifidobacterium gallicum]|uniref:Putative TonB-dependent outer membrane receptor n=1 Tax=Bifidobacterium gallicum DSM 20093 = LMG 11596 TaxID=561180 RepID=D1NUB9_9BIFI|nr:DUF1893 domain-containing protein [Bifidobacterium gallicum]EFA23323.1 hypothetical protein BIFGAL_03440 [Bifidobacterium gallicum DSM 20093 = LMG 11596]KFI58315.1 putative TonB-dependent outer membrane receptor [Bifidobacterium gallicum DSM 20093 = LMG 11596]